MAIITETMEKKKWTQKQLAIAVDVDRADISRYENGTKGAMNFKKLKIFAEALDVTIDDLMDIKTSVSEAVTNAIEHGYEETSTKNNEYEQSFSLVFDSTESGQSAVSTLKPTGFSIDTTKLR